MKNLFLIFTLSINLAHATAPAPGEYIIQDPTSFTISANVATLDPASGRTTISAIPATEIPASPAIEGVTAALPGARVMADDPALSLQVLAPAEANTRWSVLFPEGTTAASDPAGREVILRYGNSFDIPSCRIQLTVTAEVRVGSDARPVFVRSALVNIQHGSPSCARQISMYLNGLLELIPLDDTGERSLHVPTLRAMLETLQPGLGAHIETIRRFSIRAESPLLTIDEVAAAAAVAAAPVETPIDTPLIPLDYPPEHVVSER